MPFLIFTLDKAGAGDIRAAHRAAHYEYLEANAPLLIASGGLQDDAAAGFIGAAILVDVDTREAAEAFVAADPFSQAGLFASVQILRWKKAFFDGARARAP